MAHQAGGSDQVIPLLLLSSKVKPTPFYSQPSSRLLSKDDVGPSQKPTLIGATLRVCG